MNSEGLSTDRVSNLEDWEFINWPSCLMTSDHLTINCVDMRTRTSREQTLIRFSTQEDEVPTVIENCDSFEGQFHLKMSNFRQDSL